MVFLLFGADPHITWALPKFLHSISYVFRRLVSGIWREQNAIKDGVLLSCNRSREVISFEQRVDSCHGDTRRTFRLHDEALSIALFSSNGNTGLWLGILFDIDK